MHRKLSLLICNQAKILGEDFVCLEWNKKIMMFIAIPYVLKHKNAYKDTKKKPMDTQSTGKTIKL